MPRLGRRRKWGAHMERLMKRMGRADAPEQKRILELNADHPVVDALAKRPSAKGRDRSAHRKLRADFI